MKPWQISTAAHAVKYAKQYNCTVTEALNDEDFPITESEAIEILNYLNITLDEVTSYLWASEKQCKNFETELAQEYYNR